MMNKTYLKNILRDIKQTLGKVLSIGIMVGLAALVVVALTLTGPSMRKTLDKSLREYGHPDMIVRSTYGLKNEDRQILERDKNIEKITMVKTADLMDGETLIRLKSYNEDIPKSVIVSGKMPSKKGEIAISNNLSDEYQLGDRMKFSYIENAPIDDESMNNMNYEVVGFYKSSDFFMEDMRELSFIAKKELDGYAYVLDQNFDTEDFGEANVLYKETKDLDINSKEYQDFVKSKKTSIEDSLENRPKEVLKEIRSDANKEILDGEKEIKEAKEGISEAEEKLIDARAELDKGYDEYAKAKEAYNSEIAKAEAKLAQTREELLAAQNKLSQGKNEYNVNLDKFTNESAKARDEISQNERDLASKQEEIDQAIESLNMAYDKLDREFEEPYARLNTSKKELDALSLDISNKENELENLKESQDDLERNVEIEALESKLNLLRSQYEEYLREYKAKESDLDSRYNNEKAKIDRKLDETKAGQAELNKAREEISIAKDRASNESISAQNELDLAKEELDTNEARITDGWASYESGMAELKQKRESGQRELEATYRKLLDGEDEYKKNKEKFGNEKSDAIDEIKDGEEEIKDSKEAIGKLKNPIYDVESIYDNQGIDTYHQNSLNMDELTKVFPSFFYLVAMLVTLTTMKRYIEEQRTINGTLKALGYTNKKISQRFYLYGILPSLIGSLLGALVGRFIVSEVIIEAYSSGFGNLGIDYVNSIPYIIFAIVLSIVLIALTVYLSSKETVKETPANLLREKSPNIGKKILLERFTTLWKRLGFMQKITARNIFRYKSRMFMTLFGVGGCTALTFFGFAMINSIKDTVVIEQRELNHYDLIAMVDESASDDELKSLDNKIKDYYDIDISYEDITLSFDGKERDLKLVVASNTENLKDFVNLRSPDERAIDLSKEGAILSEKAAKTLGLRPGDQIELAYKDKNFKIPLTNIMENYTGDYMYISKESFEKYAGIKPSYNSKYIKGDANQAIKDLEDEKAITALINKTVIYATIDVLMANLNLVIGIITLISVLLALVVLYNLININVSERKRELATIKVLGFYPREVSSYIFKEIFILSLLGIIVGFGLGYAMFRYIINVVAPENILIYYKVNLSPFIYSGLITIAISLVLLLLVHKKLKNIDMAEAMSSGE